MAKRIDVDTLRHVGLLLLWLAVAAAVAAVMWKGCSRPVGNMASPMSDEERRQLLNHVVPGSERIEYTGFTVDFNASKHLPACVSYVLTEDMLLGDEIRTDVFAVDPQVKGCPQPDAYQGTGLHRGHLAPAADMRWSGQAMRESFLMTNICPQHRSLNEGGWGRLEEKCREWVHRHHVLVIACGPVIESGLDTIPSSGVVVPRRFFKVLLAPEEKPMMALAFIYPNTPANATLSHYVTTVDKVENLTGIDFFSSLPDDVQSVFEASSNLQLWLH